MQPGTAVHHGTNGVIVRARSALDGHLYCLKFFLTAAAAKADEAVLSNREAALVAPAVRYLDAKPAQSPLQGPVLVNRAYVTLQEFLHQDPFALRQYMVRSASALFLHDRVASCTPRCRMQCHLCSRAGPVHVAAERGHNQAAWLQVHMAVRLLLMLDTLHRHGRSAGALSPCHVIVQLLRQAHDTGLAITLIDFSCSRPLLGAPPMHACSLCCSRLTATWLCTRVSPSRAMLCTCCHR